MGSLDSSCIYGNTALQSQNRSALFCYVCTVFCFLWNIPAPDLAKGKLLCLDGLCTSYSLSLWSPQRPIFSKTLFAHFSFFYGNQTLWDVSGLASFNDSTDKTTFSHDASNYGIAFRVTYVPSFYDQLTLHCSHSIVQWQAFRLFSIWAE